MIPMISDETAFRARLKPHLDRIRAGRHFGLIDMVWSGGEAREFAGLIAEMARFMDEDAAALIRETGERLAAAGVSDRRALEIVERTDGGAVAEMAGVVAAFREGSVEGHAAHLAAGRSVQVLHAVMEMERRIYVLLPRILGLAGLALSDGRTQKTAGKSDLPVNPLEERDVFLERLSPHLDRLGLSAGFKDIDIAWEGEQAREFATLIERMAAWIDGEATELVDEARALHARAIGRLDMLTTDQARARSGGGMTAVVMPTVNLLREGSEDGFRVVWRGDGVPAMRELIRDLVDRTFIRIPEWILHLQVEAQRAIDMRAAPSGEDEPSP
ncbi:hypothetical protein [Paracoccus sp. ME4]|uniref:hypothetical protein n=1 Tax=Paracoccus sp. ME4 TaxID=3138066 RepID=UPI00398ABA0D